MKSSIFPTLFIYSGTYTTIFTIFELLHKLLHKFKHQAFLTKKEKEKQHCLRRRPAWARPTPTRPARTLRVRCSPCACSMTNGSRSSGAASPPLCGTLTGQPHLSVPSPTRAATLPQLQRSIARPSAPARAHQLRLELANRLLRLTRALPSPSYLNRITGGRPPWPTVGRPLGSGREQTSFRMGWGARCSHYYGGRSGRGAWRRWPCGRAGAPAPATLFRWTCSCPRKSSKRMSIRVTRRGRNTS